MSSSIVFPKSAPFISSDMLRDKHFAVRAIGFCLVVAIVLIAQFVIKTIRNPLWRLPGPWYSAWTALPLKKQILTGQRMHYVHALHQKYGPYVRIAPDEVAVSSPQGHAEIHRVGSKFLKSPFYQHLTDQEKQTMFTMKDPKPHGQRRKIFSRPFAKVNMTGAWEETVCEKTQLAVARMKEMAAAGPVDVLKWWSLMTNDVSSSVIYGESFDLLHRGEVNEYVEMIKNSTKGSAITGQFRWTRHIVRLLPFHSIRKYFALGEDLLAYGLNASERAMNHGSKHMLAQMIDEVEKDQGLDRADLALEASNFLFAGTDTTSSVLTYLVWSVLSHPTWKSQLEEEIDNVPQDFKQADLDNLPVLNAIIDETLRLNCAAPSGLPRNVPAGGIHIDGYFFEEGTILTTQAYTYHRDASLFPDPNVYDPARWLATTDSPRKVTAAARAVYQPFGHGSRSCIGMHLARMEIQMATVEFFRELRNAHLAPSVTPESMEQLDFFSIVPKGNQCEIVVE